MNQLVLGGVEYVVNAIVGGLVWLVGVVADGISHLALVQAHLPWVQNLKADITVLAWTILGAYVAYIALVRYILWGDGTPDPDGTILTKSLLRTAVYVGLSGFLATAMFQWGITLAGFITSTTMLHVAQSLHGLWGNIVALPGSLGGLALGLSLAIGVGVALLLVVCFQMAIRAAQLVVYVVGAPLAALGQMHVDGGVWNGWWANLVILSLSQAVQMLCFVGLVNTTQVLTSTADVHWIYAMAHHMPVATPAAMSVNVIVTVLNVVFALLLVIGWLIVAIQGPHLLKQWSYHTGVGGFAMWVGGQTASRGLTTGLQNVPRIGAWFK